MKTQESINDLDFILLNIGYAEHNADWNWKGISSPFVRLHFVVKGKAKIHLSNESFDLQENHMYLTPSYVQHSYDCEGEFHIFYIHLYENLDRKASIFDRYKFPFEIPVDELLVMLIHRLYSLNPARELMKYDPTTYDNSQELIKNLSLNYNNSDASKLETQSIINIILSRFLNCAIIKTEIQDQRIHKVITYIHERIEHPIAIEELADLANLTKDHLIRLFKKQMGCTPAKYINQKKIEKAQLLILMENISLKNVAYKLGFENISYFIRLFKKITGETPSTYRKKQ